MVKRYPRWLQKYTKFSPNTHLWENIDNLDEDNTVSDVLSFYHNLRNKT